MGLASGESMDRGGWTMCACSPRMSSIISGRLMARSRLNFLTAFIFRRRPY